MLRVFAYVLSFTSEIFTGHPLPTKSNVPILEDTRLQQPLKNHATTQHHEWVEPMGAAPPFDGGRIPQDERKNWGVACYTEDKAHPCINVIDGDEKSYWLARRGNHNRLIIDLGKPYPVNGIAVAPRQDRDFNDPQAGNVAEHKIWLSMDNTTWGPPVAYGTFWSDKLEKFSSFETRTAQYIWLNVYSDAEDSGFTAISDFNVFTRPGYEYDPPVDKVGKWGPTVNTPIVPITAFVDPLSGKVVLISSKRHDNFDQERPDFTMTVLWDPLNGTLSQASVENTRHNMFCPSTAFDAEGRMIVAGGATGKIVSIFNGTEGSWTTAARMKITRGYNAAVLNADGRMFVLGGSWGHLALVDPDEFDKDGEIYDPETDTWTMLRRCRADVTFTDDREYYRKDNHGMMFAWKDNWIFHAGPSRNMTWYSLEGRGAWAPAGQRSSSNTTSAMCGQAVMYDALAGDILLFGGAEDYFGRRETLSETYRISLGEPNTTVEYKQVNPMFNARTYAQAAVVPNGDVIVTGGQGGVPVVFDDRNPVFQAESYSPKTGKWTPLANNSIVRVYHSWTLLLPDATIASGGSGLCGDRCDVNHFDLQIFRPPYLFDAKGKEAKRPLIKSVSSTVVAPGDAITLETDEAIVDASIIRYSGTTHTVNNDQRRVPLKPIKTGPNKYVIALPDEGYVVIPGYWMLFVLNDQGVPSVSQTIKILIEHK